VSVEADNRQMAQEAIKKFGTIDVLINNAGISMRALFEDVDLDVIKKVMDINFYGVLYATKYCLAEIIKNKGSIVGISSIAGYRGFAWPGRLFGFKVRLEWVLRSFTNGVFKTRRSRPHGLPRFYRPPTFAGAL
jgi:NADP-dependent 3-hydroxy acid dehydrogenase YdfG